jgi:F-type H+-transporting ATPase subunit gamma
MKMVAAAKYAKAERELKGARSYGEGAQAFFDNLAVEPAVDDTKTKEGGTKRLLILITSDRGLCGAVHTSIAKVCSYFGSLLLNTLSFFRRPRTS